MSILLSSCLFSKAQTLWGWSSLQFTPSQFLINLIVAALFLEVMRCRFFLYFFNDNRFLLSTTKNNSVKKVNLSRDIPSCILKQKIALFVFLLKKEKPQHCSKGERLPPQQLCKRQECGNLGPRRCGHRCREQCFTRDDISCALLSVNEHFSRGNWHGFSDQHQRHLRAGKDSMEHEACLHPSWNSRHIIHSLTHRSTQKPLTPTITHD